MSDCKIYEVRVNEYGDKEWHLNGERHREDGPAIERANGTKYWYLNGKRHREDGPAVEFANGDKYWYLNGKYHREDGPAIECANGTKYWWLNGEYLTEEEHKIRTNRPCTGKIVELWLQREVFCWYDEANDTLNFGEENEQA